jgi:hypothetical protein
MKNIFFCFITLIFLISCSDGRIQQPVTDKCKSGDVMGQGYYLDNTSETKTIKFTIKRYAGSKPDVVTTYILKPGMDTFLGCTTLAHDLKYEIVHEQEMK